jgi:hypothetical protein
MADNRAIIDIISQTADKYHVPRVAALAIAYEESGFDPRNVGDNGTSFGLFQLHYGGQADGYTPDQLFDPQTNADIGIRNMQQAAQEAQRLGLTGWDMVDYIATHSGHPGYGGPGHYPAYESALRHAYDVVTKGNYADASGGTGGTGSEGDGSQPRSAPRGNDPIDVVNKALQIQGFDIFHPVNSIAQDAVAISLRAVLVIVGIICIIFGLYAAVKGAA